jgi:rubrerythrin
MRRFDDLSEKELLALAISLEEQDERIYADYADGLRETFPASAAVFEGMCKEEAGHRARLMELYRQRFGEHIPLIRREDVRGFVHRRPTWLVRPLGLDAVRRQASTMEAETRQFYERVAGRTRDLGIRHLLDELAAEERVHERKAETLEAERLEPDTKRAEVRPAGHSARPRGPHGRLGVDAGPGVRRGGGDAADPRRPGGRPGGVRRGGNQHGLRRGAVRRR